MKYKYIILDFGNVLVTPTTGDWNITPKLLELIPDLDINMFKNISKRYSYMLSEKINTLEEEYDMFYRFYNNILSTMNYKGNISKEVAYDRTYNFDKYTLCKNIRKELKQLKNKYKLILLTDNWPCVIPYLKKYRLYSYFKRIYVSSFYGTEKKDGLFFDYPIKDFNIKKGEALFIDDTEVNLDVALKKGFHVLLMDRYKDNINSKYKVINDLFDI